MGDLSQAIEFRSRAIDISPDSHPFKPIWLSRLAHSLHARYERTGDARDLEQAVVHQTHAVVLTPDGHPTKASQLINLGNQLETRFKRLTSLEDLDAAIAYQTTATGSELLSSARRTFDPFPFEVVGSFGTSGTHK